MTISAWQLQQLRGHLSVNENMGDALLQNASFPVKIEFEVKYSILMDVLKIDSVQGTFMRKWPVVKGLNYK